jgi:hypothetical protein
LRVVASILVIVAVAAVLVAAQPAPGIDPGKIRRQDGSDVHKLADVVTEFEKASGKKVHRDGAIIAAISLGYVVPINWQPTADWLRSVIEGALLRTGMVLLTRDDGDYEVARQAEAKAAEVDEKGLMAARADAWVRIVVPGRMDWQPALNPPDMRCIVETRPDFAIMLTGYARDVRPWREQRRRAYELEFGVEQTYSGLALDALQLRVVINALFPKEATYAPADKGFVITAPPHVHKQLETLLPRK